MLPYYMITIHTVFIFSTPIRCAMCIYNNGVSIIVYRYAMNKVNMVCLASLLMGGFQFHI
jgi:hypothetical protein